MTATVRMSPARLVASANQRQHRFRQTSGQTPEHLLAASLAEQRSSTRSLDREPKRRDGQSVVGELVNPCGWDVPGV